MLLSPPLSPPLHSIVSASTVFATHYVDPVTSKVPPPPLPSLLQMGICMRGNNVAFTDVERLNF